MNKSPTRSDSDTPVTRGRSGPVRYEAIDSDGNDGYETFETAYAAVAWAKLHWPDQEQDEDRTGKGWDVQVAGCE